MKNKAKKRGTKKYVGCIRHRNQRSLAAGQRSDYRNRRGESNENDIVDEFSSLIDADVTISPYAQAVHGISAQMLCGQPQPALVFRAFQQFVGHLPLIAHNARSDLNFLHAEYARRGYRLTNKIECALQLSGKQHPQTITRLLHTPQEADEPAVVGVAFCGSGFLATINLSNHHPNGGESLKLWG